nr:hypothetical protein [Tanacetum cinerariifolium]
NRTSSFKFRLLKLIVGALDHITKKLKVFPKNELIECFLEILGLRKKYSLRFRRHKLTHPYLTDENLKILGIKMNELIECFLEILGLRKKYSLRFRRHKGPRTVILNAS